MTYRHAINYKKFILISTGSIFSSDSKNINPNSFYGLSKFIGEKLFEILQEENQRQHFIFRLPIVIGSNSDNNIVDEFVKKMLKNKKIEIYGNGRIKRNIIQANDVARLIFKSCINKKYKGKFKITPKVLRVDIYENNNSTNDALLKFRFEFRCRVDF